MKHEEEMAKLGVPESEKMHKNQKEGRKQDKVDRTDMTVSSECKTERGKDDETEGTSQPTK